MFMSAEHKHSLKITLTAENAAEANITSLRPLIICVKNSFVKLMTHCMFAGFPTVRDQRRRRGAGHPVDVRFAPTEAERRL